MAIKRYMRFMLLWREERRRLSSSEHFALHVSSDGSVTRPQTLQWRCSSVPRIPRENPGGRIGLAARAG
jgi:hypothetical protein